MQPHQKPFSGLDPFSQMQKTVDIVLSSPHPENKIAAGIFGRDKSGREFSLSRTNYWPQPILDNFGMEARLGNASGTVHAETASILAAGGSTDGASLCITDPFCPNCAKNMAEAGIRTVYIDHKGFRKDFVARRAQAFENMSMRICEKAGISVYELWRKEERLIPILQFSPSYIPPEDSPVEHKPSNNADRDAFLATVNSIQDRHHSRKIAVALSRDANGSYEFLTARSHPAVGYTMKLDLPEIENPQGKYNFMLEPVNRLLMHAARRGVKIVEGFLYSSLVPTAREQVNMIGAGLHSIYVGNMAKSRDECGLQAMETLRNAGTISFLTVS
ncbi:MAG TPA: deoxycytidylate deaminase [Alphaproteobacteria bacterium]